MKQFLILIVFCGLGASLGIAQTGKPLKTANDSIGYAIGMNIGNDFKRQGVDVSMDALYQGMIDAMGSKPTALTEQQQRALLTSYQTKMQAKQNAEKAAKADAALKKGEDFLAQNKSKPGIKVLPNGLQYEVLVEGTGISPTATDKFTAHYRGSFIDGTEFESSYKNGQPITYPVNGMIQAWQIILPMMKEGGKVRLYSPSNLAYGPSGQAPKIGPNEVLIFDMELLKVN